MTPPSFSAAQRRARTVRRHHLARTGTDPTAVTADLVALHSSDPATPLLSLWARIPDLTVADVDAALYEDRRMWRLHAMRRTLWIVTTDDAADVMAAASAAVARAERTRLEKVLATALPGVDGDAWLVDAAAQVRAVMADGQARTTAQLGAALPVLQTSVTMGSGRWTAEVALSSRLLFLMALDGELVRGPSASWRSSQYRWTATDAWFGAPAAVPAPVEVARAALLGRLLDRFGPCTTVDVRWWTGWTAKQATAALAAVAAAEVSTDDGPAWVLPGDDHEPEPPKDAAPVVGLLPGLDPTVMGWKQRDHYLDPTDVGLLFDPNGNAGPAVLVDGWVVGGWGQRPDGQVVTHLTADVGSGAARLVAVEAARLTAWLDGTVVMPRFPSPLSRRLMR